MSGAPDFVRFLERGIYAMRQHFHCQRLAYGLR